MAFLKLFLRLGIGLALIFLLLHKHGVELEKVGQRMLALPFLFVLAALALDLAGQTLCAWRWTLITRLAGQPISFRAAWPIYFSGMFFNTCLPTNVGGDVVRIVGLSRHTGSKSAAFASVFMDRNVGLAALLLLGLLSSLCYPTTIQATVNAIRPEPIVLPLWPLFVCLSLGYLMANVILMGGHLFEIFDRLFFRRLPRKGHAKIIKLHNALQAYRRPFAGYLLPLLFSLAYQASEAALVWILALGLGLDLPLWVFGAMVMLQAVAGLLPISIGNIGVREGIFCAVLLGQASVLGVSPNDIKDDALALGMIYYLGVVVLSGLLGGLVYLVAGVPRPTARELTELENAGASSAQQRALPAANPPTGGSLEARAPAAAGAVPPPAPPLASASPVLASREERRP